jgi:hypothetical protein
MHGAWRQRSLYAGDASAQPMATSEQQLGWLGQPPGGGGYRFLKNIHNRN